MEAYIVCSFFSPLLLNIDSYTLFHQLMRRGRHSLHATGRWSVVFCRCVGAWSVGVDGPREHKIKTLVDCIFVCISLNRVKQCVYLAPLTPVKMAIGFNMPWLKNMFENQAVEPTNITLSTEETSVSLVSPKLVNTWTRSEGAPAVTQVRKAIYSWCFLIQGWCMARTKVSFCETGSLT